MQPVGPHDAGAGRAALGSATLYAWRRTRGLRAPRLVCCCCVMSAGGTRSPTPPLTARASRQVPAGGAGGRGAAADQARAALLAPARRGLRGRRRGRGGARRVRGRPRHVRQRRRRRRLPGRGPGTYFPLPCEREVSAALPSWRACCSAAAAGMVSMRMHRPRMLHAPLAWIVRHRTSEQVCACLLMLASHRSCASRGRERGAAAQVAALVAAGPEPAPRAPAELSGGADPLRLRLAAQLDAGGSALRLRCELTNRLTAEVRGVGLRRAPRPRPAPPARRPQGGGRPADGTLRAHALRVGAAGACLLRAERDWRAASARRLHGRRRGGVLTGGGRAAPGWRWAARSWRTCGCRRRTASRRCPRARPRPGMSASAWRPLARCACSRCSRCPRSRPSCPVRPARACAPRGGACGLCSCRSGHSTAYLVPAQSGVRRGAAAPRRAAGRGAERPGARGAAQATTPRCGAACWRCRRPRSWRRRPRPGRPRSSSSAGRPWRAVRARRPRASASCDGSLPGAASASSGGRRRGCVCHCKRARPQPPFSAGVRRRRLSGRICIATAPPHAPRRAPSWVRAALLSGARASRRGGGGRGGRAGRRGRRGAAGGPGARAAGALRAAAAARAGRLPGRVLRCARGAAPDRSAAPRMLVRGWLRWGPGWLCCGAVVALPARTPCHVLTSPTAALP